MAALGPEWFAAAGREAARYLPALPGWEGFRSALIFISMKDEIDTRPVIETALAAGKRVFVPRVEGEGMTFYRYGATGGGIAGEGAGPALGAALAPEDFPLLVLCPGLAFDRRGGRLGRGRGFYDRFLAGLDAGLPGSKPRGGPLSRTVAGLCGDCQLVEETPAESWDRPMEALLTERGLWIVPKARA